MEFETRIINGKPSIFYKNDVQKPSTKKLNTKSVKAKKEIKKSMEISGEEDKVKPSPRLNENQNDTQLKMIFSALNQNGVKLSQNQINSLLEQIQKSQQPLKNNSFEQNEQITNKNNYYGQEESISSHSKFKKNEPTIADFESHVNQSEFEENKINMNNENKYTGNRLSLIEKKKLKWQQDKDLLEKLNQQENYDSLKTLSPRRFYPNSFSNQVQKENIQNDLVPNKLSLTEKKKLQWQKEREEREKRELEQRMMSNEIIRYNQDPFNSSPETKTSNEIADFLMKKKTSDNIQQSDYNKFGGSIKNLEYDPTKQESLVNLLRKSNSLNSLDNQRNLHIETNNIQDEISDKKKKFMRSIEKERNTLALSDDYNYKNSNKIDQLEEFKRIKQQIEEITAVENSLKSEEKNLINNSKFEENKNKLDQSRVPPAMRTSISFGGVTYDDEIKKAKELERKKWLQELEEQKKGKIIEMKLSPKQKFQDNLSSPFTPEPKNFEEKSFGRTRNLLDPAQIDELERKKKQNLQHKLDIEAQIAEKKRIKMIEEEIQNLNNIKIESEALELKETSKLNEERKKQNLHYQNFEKILNSSRQPETDVSPSVLQGEYNKYDQETKTMRSNITETRSQEIYRKMQEAELAAAEEKHKKLLKRLQKGGHDTSQLERKFSELKAKLTGNPKHLIRETNSQTANNIAEFKFMESSRTNNNTSHLSERNSNEINYDKGYGYASNRMLENKDRKSDGETIQRLFKLLRENTNGLPAEITNEDLRLLLKNVDNTKENLIDKERNNYDQRELKNKFEKSNEMSEKIKTGIGKDGKPIWNYKNPKGKKAVSNSQKDPFYAERAQKAEERKNKRIEYYKNFNQREKIRSKEKRDNMHSNRSDQSNDDYVSVKMDNVGVGENLNVKSTKNEKKMQNESIMNLLSKNLANNPIYEEDEDLYLKDHHSINKSDLKIKDDYFNNQENSNYGFVPFMRTNEILDPVHAGSPVPPSRESSATKRDREKARQAYIQNMRPSDYGYTYDGYSNRSLIKDPLLNNGLVKNNPTPRQEQILNQLASLKQSLINKQKEIASSIYNDSNENFD